MDLSEFVRTTLCQIIDGVVAAQEKAKEQSALINPKEFNFYREGKQHSTIQGSMTDVTFHVALTSSEGTATSGGIGVFLGTINLGSKGASDQKSAAQTSVEFSVPIRLPTMR